MAPIKRSIHNSRPEKVGFFDLSGEIRNQIYRIWFVADYPIDIAPPLWKRLKHFKDLKYAPHEPEEYPVRLFRVNKQMHHEAASVFYSENAFQLSILYPIVSRGGCFPPGTGFGLINTFAVLGWCSELSERHHWPNGWQFQCFDRTVLRWEYIMPSEKRSRSSIERQAREGEKTTEIYWPSEGYRRMVKRLHIQLFLEKKFWKIKPDPNMSYRVVQSSLATLFEGILNQAHVELVITAPEIKQHEQWDSGDFRRLRRLMKAFTPLEKAMALIVTTNDELEDIITEKRCVGLQVAIRQYAKDPKFGPWPPWQSRW